MKCSALAAGVVSCLAISVAHADIEDGSDITFSVTHPGLLAATHTGTHTWGGTDSYEDFFMRSMTFDSTGTIAGFDNALSIDLTGMFYTSFFPNSTATMELFTLPEPVDVSSVAIFANGVNVLDNVVALDDDHLLVTWQTNDVIALTTPTENVTVAWNSQPVPAPGAIALLGVTGLVARPRRRRD